jgi:hypothetical protein
LRQQFAIDLLDQAGAEPANEAVGESGEKSGGEEGDDAGGAAGEEADAPSDAAELRAAAFAEPNEETAMVGDAATPCDATGGPHFETSGKYFENHSTSLEPSLGKHQYAPDAKKKTWTASQRVRKKMCASTIPRHRAAISLNTVPSAAKIKNAAAKTAVPNRRRGSGAAGGSKNCGTDCGTGGCGLNATARPQRFEAGLGTILIQNRKVERVHCRGFASHIAQAENPACRRRSTGDARQQGAHLATSCDKPKTVYMTWI